VAVDGDHPGGRSVAGKERLAFLIIWEDFSIKRRSEFREFFSSLSQHFARICDCESVSALNRSRRPPEKHRGEFSHPWSPLTHSYMVRSSCSLFGHRTPPRYGSPEIAPVTKTRGRRLYYAQCRVPVRLLLVSRFRKPHSAAAVVLHLTGGESTVSPHV
jgi:hypothetical protein